MDTITKENFELFNKLYKRATDRFQSYVMEKIEPTYDSWLAKTKINKSIDELKRCLLIIPEHIQTMYILGKCYQSLGDDDSSLVWFEKVTEKKYQDINYFNDPILFENVLNACRLECSVIYTKRGNIEKAILLGEILLQSDNNNFDDLTVITNQATNFILMGNLEEANKLIFIALSINPQNATAIELNELIVKIKKGEVARPLNLQEMMS